jgi:hypothetical protein
MIKMSSGLYIKLFLSGFNNTLIFLTTVRKILKFHENPSSVCRVIPCGRTDGRTDMTKPIVDFRNFANAPKNQGDPIRTQRNDN